MFTSINPIKNTLEHRNKVNRPSQRFNFSRFVFDFLYSGKKTWKSGGAQWLSGRVLDSRTMGRGFEPHRCHCVVVLEQDTFILA